MPTSPRRKIYRTNNAFRQIRNIIHRADVGIGPYDNLLPQSEAGGGLPRRGNAPPGNFLLVGSCVHQNSVSLPRHFVPRNDRGVYGLQQEKSWVLRFSDKKAIRFALSIGAVRSPR